MGDVAALRRLAWTSGVPALGAVASFTVSAGGPNLLSTRAAVWLDQYAVVMLTPVWATLLGIATVLPAVIAVLDHRRRGIDTPDDAGVADHAGTAPRVSTVLP
ncbi:hypothetical protein ACWEFJ_09565 [Actinosynnema sp. NPDC004786]